MSYVWDKYKVEKEWEWAHDGREVHCNICDVNFTYRGDSIEMHLAGFRHSLGMKKHEIPDYVLNAFIGDKDEEIYSLNEKVNVLEGKLQKLQGKLEKLEQEKYLLRLFGESITQIILSMID